MRAPGGFLLARVDSRLQQSVGFPRVNRACMEFGQRMLGETDVRDRAVLEVGARDVNGSLRSWIESLDPASYFGVDILPGTGVDRIGRVEVLLADEGPDRFDLIIATEVVEHVHDWRAAFDNMKAVLKPQGLLLLTTRSPGFPLHGYPSDYWRYEASDIGQILADCIVEALERDPSEPGVFVLARKPVGWQPTDLSWLRLTSAVSGRRLRSFGFGERLLYAFVTRYLWFARKSRRIIRARGA
jgi:SAM-dependent methyltransferase